MAQQAVLLPRSDAARAYTEGTGQHLFIVDGSQLGRSPVTAPGAYQLPGDWLQVSGSHCKFSWSHEQVLKPFRDCLMPSSSPAAGRC